MAKHHLNKKEVISPRLIIKYHDKNPPNKATKAALATAVQTSAKIMRAAVWKMDKVVFFRRDEDYLKAIVNTHFRLSTVTDKQRGYYLNKVRMCMLSTSFHLNTGAYLLDIDNDHRKIAAGEDYSEGFDGTEGYVANFALNTTGPVHIDFSLAAKYSARGLARVIIHEATHCYWKTVDVFYSHEDGYNSMTADQAVTNADSFAYAALSIEAKALQTHATLEQSGDH